MLNERLKELRKSFKLTQVEMAKKLNISQPAYGDWERGKFEPSPEKLKILANFFNVSTDYLLGNTDIKNPDEINLSDFEILFRKTSNKLSDEEKFELEQDLKRVLIERQKIIDERIKERNK
ncbi:helix-turn-helix transcriptional regulator [Streptococcus uberis]|uniref:helix-turn-helix domain-containing protein n=2 Tax=Streptococcus uberis TaxID=1349 RepID=UPI003342BDDC